jgi:hypothetical protein
MFVIIIKVDNDLEFVKDFSKVYPFPIKKFVLEKHAEKFARTENLDKYSVIDESILLKIID